MLVVDAEMTLQTRLVTCGQKSLLVVQKYTR